jgi:tetratricopeptide (TPR) repeat protein
MQNLGVVYGYRGRHDEGIALLEQAMEIRRRVLGQKHPDTLATSRNLAALYFDHSRHDDAISLMTKMLEQARRELDGNDPRLANDLAMLGRGMVAAKHFDEAEPLLREALAIRQQKLPNTWQVASVRSLLGESLSARGKYEEAETHLLEGFEGLNGHRDKLPMPPNGRKNMLSESLQRLVDHFQRTGNGEERIKWETRLRVPDTIGDGPSTLEVEKQNAADLAGGETKPQDASSAK